MKDCVDSGLIMDITELAGNSESLKRFETGAKSLSDYFGTGDAIYAFPTNASTEAKPTDCSQMRYNAPENGFYTRWDYYYELGCPEIKNMDDMLKVSKQMQDNHPLSDSGKPAYAFSLFPDWDGKWLATASKYCIMYGYGGSTGYILFNSDDEATAQEVHDRLNSGELNFVDAVKEYWQDPGSVEGDGDVGWNNPSNLAKEYKDGL